MDDAMSAIRRAIIDEEAGEMTLTPAEPRTSGEEARAKRIPEAGLLSPKVTAAVGSAVDGNCEEARADARGRGPRNASPHAEIVAGREFAKRSRADGAGRN